VGSPNVSAPTPPMVGGWRPGLDFGTDDQPHVQALAECWWPVLECSGVVYVLRQAAGQLCCLAMSSSTHSKIERGGL
jgi:hypothetical protein